MGYYLASLRDLADRQVSPTKLWRKFFAVRLMVAVPAGQAASLVSAKGSVGDSTWPSQKTALALPATEWRKIVAHGETVGLVATNQAPDGAKEMFCAP